MSKKNKQEKAEVSIVKTEKLNWKGAEVLLSPATSEADRKNQKLILALSMAFDLPPQGITILANNPYINKQGLEYVFNKHKEKQKWGYFIAKPVELAKTAGDTAVFVTELYNAQNVLIANGYGSANAGNIKMGTIKPFLNEMAETRSQNRCLRKVLSPILYETFIENLKDIEKEDKQLLLVGEASKFTSVTAEEIGEAEEVKPERLLTEEEQKAINSFLQEIVNAKDVEELKVIGTKIKEAKFGENQTAVLREAWAGRNSKLAFEK